MQISFAHHKLVSALQPIVNGVAQNIITIQAGHVTVNLKAEVERNAGTLPVMRLRQRIGPFCFKDINSRVSHLLLALSLPAQLFNLSILYILQVRFHYSFSLTVPFIASFTVLIFTQVFIILQLSHVAVFLATKAGYNPDTAAVPLIAALNNLIGNCALAAMFAFLEAMGDPSSMIRE